MPSGTDATNIQADLPIKIVGSTATGLPTNPVNSDALGNLFTVSQDVAGSSTAMGALNAAVNLALQGAASVGLQLAAGTLIGTLVCECSLDGGATYPGIGIFYDPSNSTQFPSLVFSSANTAKTLSILPVGGSSHIRIRVSAFSSGTANAILRASQVNGAAGAVTAAAFSTVTNTTPTLTANSATQILASNVNRKYAYISNNTGFSVSIQFSSATGLNSTSKGLVIATGNYYELKGDNLYTGAVFAYTQAAGTVLGIAEGTP